MSECDFCGAGSPVRIYACRSFKADSALVGASCLGQTFCFNSVEGWSACAGCCVLIDAHDLSGLVGHSVAAFRAVGYTISPQLRAHIEYTYELFFLNRMVP
jgi:hypothetical protein